MYVCMYVLGMGLLLNYMCLLLRWVNTLKEDQMIGFS